ncbi:MAG: GntR family transcriptional regulator [Caulobacteraceae bacterium]|nr:GntR family transcriptional regulator [Caulobacteraceae bacterium]
MDRKSSTAASAVARASARPENRADGRGLVRQPTRDLGASLHHQVFQVLRSGIMSGRYGDGDYLPGEEALTEMFAVSRATIRRAMLSLEQEGLIERRQGRGTRVVWQGRGEPVKLSLSSHLDRIDLLNTRSSVKPRSYELVSPPDAPLAALGLAPSELAYRLVRLRRSEGRPLWMMVNYFPAAIGEALRTTDFACTTIYDALAEAGRPCARAEETVGAVLADPEVAAEIDIKVGAPLLELSRLMLDAAGAPLAWQLTLIPPERRKLRLVIEPDEDGLLQAGMFTPFRAAK